MDHHDHEALVAIDPDTGRGVGVARYVRDPKRHPSAEVAFAVLESWQGRRPAPDDEAPMTPRPGALRTAQMTKTSDPVSDQLDRWLHDDGEKSVGSLLELFQEKSFAILFVLLLGVPALPLPTGGATHVFEVIAIVLAAQLIIGRDHIWLPSRWRSLQLAGNKQ